MEADLAVEVWAVLAEGSWEEELAE